MNFKSLTSYVLGLHRKTILSVLECAPFFGIFRYFFVITRLTRKNWFKKNIASQLPSVLNSVRSTRVCIEHIYIRI